MGWCGFSYWIILTEHCKRTISSRHPALTGRVLEAIRTLNPADFFSTSILFLLLLRGLAINNNSQSRCAGKWLFSPEFGRVQRPSKGQPNPVLVVPLPKFAPHHAPSSASLLASTPILLPFIRSICQLRQNSSSSSFFLDERRPQTPFFLYPALRIMADVNDDTHRRPSNIPPPPTEDYTLPEYRLKRKLDDPEKTPLLLVACGSFSPITYLHLRMFEMAADYVKFSTDFELIGGYLSPSPTPTARRVWQAQKTGNYIQSSFLER